jgi:hypothetical protein
MAVFVITATVTDTAGRQATASVTVDVLTPPAQAGQQQG